MIERRVLKEKKKRVEGVGAKECVGECGSSFHLKKSLSSKSNHCFH